MRTINHERMKGAPPPRDAARMQLGNSLFDAHHVEAEMVIVKEPFVLPPSIGCLAFFADPFGNLIELAEVLP